jgi:ATP-dependent Zn protease
VPVLEEASRREVLEEASQREEREEREVLVEASQREEREVLVELQSRWIPVECSCSGDSEQPKSQRRQ